MDNRTSETQNKVLSLPALPVLSSMIVVTIFVFAFHFSFTKTKFLFDDAADYFRASQGQAIATYLNVNSDSPVELYRLRKQQGFAGHPWDYLYSRNDDAALRHFHVPFSFYMMDVAADISKTAEAQRIVVSIVTAITCGLIAGGLISMDVPIALSILFAVLAGIQSRFTEVSVDPTPHSWYMLFAVIALFSTSRYLSAPKFWSLAVAAISLGCAVATLEFSLELIASIFFSVAVLWCMGKWSISMLKQNASVWLRAVLLFLLTTFALWPGGWIRGGYFESYGVLGATVLLKNHSAFGEVVTAHSIYDKLFYAHWGLACLAWITLAFGIFLVIKKAASIPSIVFGIYTLVSLGLGIADHFRLSTYISEFLLFFLIACAFIVRDTLRLMPVKYQQVLMVASCVLVAAVSFQEWNLRKNSFIDRPWLAQIIDGVNSSVPKGSVLLVNTNWETYDLYLPGYCFEPTVAKNNLIPRIPSRCTDVQYWLLNNLKSSDAQTVLVHSYPTYAPGKDVLLYKVR